MSKAPDEDDADREKGPERRCIVTGAVGPKEAMIRFVVGPDDVLVADIDARLPGRGMWLSAKRDVVNTAVAKSAFAKAARRKVQVPGDLLEVLERQLRRRCLDTIGLARRAGQAVSGFDKVRAALKSGEGAVLLEAADAAADGAERLRPMAAGRAVVTVLDGAELGAAFGRERTVHGLLAKGRLAEGLVRDAGRLSGILGADTGTEKF